MASRPHEPPEVALRLYEAASGVGWPIGMTVGLAVSLLLSCVACASGSPAPAPASPFQGTVPTSPPLTRDQIDALIAQLNAAKGKPPAQAISASVFALNSAQPDTTNRSWTRFLSIYGNPRVKAAALDNGWFIIITGYTDSSGSAEFNHQLSGARAQTARQALLDRGYPPNRVFAIAGDVGGPNPADRRVVIEFSRKAPHG